MTLKWLSVCHDCHELKHIWPNTNFHVTFASPPNSVAFYELPDDHSKIPFKCPSKPEKLFVARDSLSRFHVRMMMVVQFGIGKGSTIKLLSIAHDYHLPAWAGVIQSNRNWDVNLGFSNQGRIQRNISIKTVEGICLIKSFEVHANSHLKASNAIKIKSDELIRFLIE